MVSLIFLESATTTNTILQRAGNFFSKLVNRFVAGFMQMAQYLGRQISEFLVGVMEQVASNIPGVTDQQSAVIAGQVRIELENWNAIFPIYEALTCMTIILTFRIAVGIWRAFMTMMWNAGNIHNAMPKIGGTG